MILAKFFCLLSLQYINFDPPLIIYHGITIVIKPVSSMLPNQKQLWIFILQNPLMSLSTKQPVGECFSFIDFCAGFNV